MANLGRLDEVMKYYDPLLIHEGDLVHLLMIRKDRADQFEGILVKDGFRPRRRLKLDLTEIADRLNQGKARKFDLFDD